MNGGAAYPPVEYCRQELVPSFEEARQMIVPSEDDQGEMEEREEDKTRFHRRSCEAWFELRQLINPAGCQGHHRFRFNRRSPLCYAADCLLTSGSARAWVRTPV